MASEKTPLLDHGDKPEPSLEVGFEPSPSDKDKPVPLAPLKTLFRFCDKTDKILVTLGVIGSVLYGVLTPAQFLIFGSSTNDFVDYTLCTIRPNCTDVPDLEHSMTIISMWYLGIAVANYLFAWMGLGLLGYSAERQVHKMRLAMFRNILYQEIGWFDEHSSGELNARLTEDLNNIADGIGPKLGRLISSVVSFLTGYVLGFAYVWRLTLVMLTLIPLIIVVGIIMGKTVGAYTAKELEAYSKAGHVAEQSISSIRTVAAFGGEEKQAELYNDSLVDACKYGIKKNFSTGFGIGIFLLVVYCNYAVSIWYLIKLVRDGDANAGDGIMVFFALATTASIMGQTGSSAEALAAAKAAAVTIFKIIDRKSEIDASSNSGLRPTFLNYEVDFSRINFVYPTRQSVQILKDFNLKVPSGKRVALVGESGCGKSTIVKLVQRFYDPAEGSVFLDGQDIKSLNVSYLRSLIGVVNQEPVLFATTIAENIAFGHDGATQREIEEAAKMANAHNFINNFPQGYDTLCGERGVQMSGGQKQRIAIARALVRNPKILLLDEATSALDSHSEAVVQEALDRAGEGRTTIIIAHRLSTIKNADIIVAVRDGDVAEMGTHEELMALDGLYSTLVKLQGSHADDDDDDDDDNEDDLEEAIEIGEGGAFKLGSIVSSGTEHRTVTSKHEDDVVEAVSFGSILKLNAPEWKFLFIGCFGAALYGTYPFLYGIAFGRIYDAFSKDPDVKEQRDDMEDTAKKLAVMYVAIGVGCGVGNFLKDWFLGKAGHALTKRLREKSFLAYLRQDMTYYDDPSHGTGAICTQLASEVSTIQGATGPQLGLVVSAVVTIIGGFIVAFLATWRVTLIMLAFMPLLVFAGLFLNTFMGRSSSTVVKSSAGQTSEETLSNIQTVVSLGQEEEFFERYRQALATPYRKAKISSHLSGLSIGSFMGIISLADAAAFRYGGYLVTHGHVTIKDMMTSIVTVLICAIQLGQGASMTPDYVKAKQAADRVFHLLKKVPSIDSYSEAGEKPDVCNGEIQLANVRFRYPTRRQFKVLRKCSLSVKPGQTVALVGTSGCGKSTTVSLVERFYDVNSGSVMIDGHDVKDLNLKWLRKEIGIVSQEPVLFDLSIRDNIAYGDTTAVFRDKEIQEAARSANIHDFISTLPKGYDTIVGDKGTLISGGQKQRIAIARALIRNPKILLLDEATSALDTESEKAVQQALDKASIGRTTLVIAHRLSTIQHADAIVVIKDGRVVERGTHQQLLALKGIYHALNKAQSLASKEA